MAHYRLAQCEGLRRREEEGMGASGEEGYRRGPDIAQPHILSVYQDRGWGQGTWMSRDKSSPPPTSILSDTLCSRVSQLSSRTSEITGTSCFLVTLCHLTNGETKAGDEMSLSQVAESGSRMPGPASFRPEQP